MDLRTPITAASFIWGVWIQPLRALRTVSPICTQLGGWTQAQQRAPFAQGEAARGLDNAKSETAMMAIRGDQQPLCSDPLLVDARGNATAWVLPRPMRESVREEVCSELAQTFTPALDHAGVPVPASTWARIVD